MYLLPPTIKPKSRPFFGSVVFTSRGRTENVMDGSSCTANVDVEGFEPLSCWYNSYA